MFVASLSFMTLTTLLAAMAASTVLTSGHAAARPRTDGAAATPASTSTERRVLTAVRVEGGLGIIAYQAGIEAERWFNNWIAGGLHGAIFGAGLFDRSDGCGAGAHVALRTSTASSFGILTLGGGMARVTETDGELFFNWNGDGRDRPTHAGGRAYIRAGLGWLFHPSLPRGGLEIGPVVLADVAGEHTAFTLNLAVGYAAMF